LSAIAQADHPFRSRSLRCPPLREFRAGRLGTPEEGCEKRTKKTPPGGGAFSSIRVVAISDRDHVGSLRALRAVGDIKAHLLTFGQALEARTGDGAEMYEDIRATVVLGDEAEALGIVEPLDGSSIARHVTLLPCIEWCVETAPLPMQSATDGAAENQVMKRSSE